MKFNNLIVSVSILFLLLFLSVGIAAANENNTIVSPENDIGDDLSDSDESVDSNDSAEVYNAKIIAKNTTQKYNGDNEVAVKIVNKENGIVNSAKVRINDRITPTYDDEGIYYFYFDLKPGNHKLKVTLDDKYHKAKPVLINLKIVKSKFTGQIKCKSYWGTDKDKLTMKATVYNDELFYHENGYVTFKVNGKSYKVKTKNGVAIKTIRIKKAGTFTYIAKFTSEKYSSSVTGKGKLYVYSTSKKSRTFNVKGYKIVVPLKKYIKLVHVKNTKKWVSYEIKTNKFIKQTYRHYYMGNNYVYKTVNARGIICISFGGQKGIQTAPPNKYSLYLFTRCQGPDRFCTPSINGQKISSEINKLNKAKSIY